MDTTDPEITFDSEGVCNHCRQFENTAKYYWLPHTGQEKLAALVQEIKKYGKDKEYDAIIGLSGGVDSSYLAYWAAKAGLRLLAVHVDGGWNSELAVKNIENIVKKLGIDLYTYVVDWEEMRDLQLSFFKACVANQDVPQDHAYFAALYNFAVQNNIKYVLNGSNLATESILPRAWGHNAMDIAHLKGIHKLFGTRKLKKFPLVSFFKYYIYYPYIKKMEIVRPLNYMDYNKEKAMELLNTEVGWTYYGGKHYESRFTKFFQAYWLPEKFGYDKRKAHLSSLIVSGQLTREQALKEMEKPLYEKKELAHDKELIAKKLGISVEEFQALMSQPKKTFRDYPNNEWKIKIFQKAFILKNYFKIYLNCFMNISLRLVNILKRPFSIGIALIKKALK